MIWLFVSFLVCIALAAFFSGAEMAFVSVNKFKVREKADSGDERAKRILKLQSDPETFLTSILIGNNIVNIAATAIMTYWLDMQFGLTNEWLVTAIMIPILIILGEMVPKDYGRLYNEQFLLVNSTWLTLLAKIVGMPSRVLVNGIGALMKSMGVEKDKGIFVSEDEFRLMIEEGVKSGVLSSHEKQIVNVILDFERTQVQSVMVPLAQVPKVPITGMLKDVKDIAKKTKTTMVLVYEEIPSIVVGMVYVFDLLFETEEEKGLKGYLRSPIFVHQHTPLEKAFLTLQQKRQSYAVVTDDHGEVSGVAPIQRLLAV